MLETPPAGLCPSDRRSPEFRLLITRVKYNGLRTLYRARPRRRSERPDDCACGGHPQLTPRTPAEGAVRGPRPSGAPTSSAPPAAIPKQAQASHRQAARRAAQGPPASSQVGLSAGSRAAVPAGRRRREESRRRLRHGRTPAALRHQGQGQGRRSAEGRWRHHRRAGESHRRHPQGPHRRHGDLGRKIRSAQEILARPHRSRPATASSIR